MNQSTIDRIKTYCKEAYAGNWTGQLFTSSEAGARFFDNALIDLPAAIAEIERFKAENDGHVKEIARLIKVHEPRYHELLSLRAELAHLKSQLEQAKAFRQIGRELET